jgi:phage shock protein C
MQDIATPTVVEEPMIGASEVDSESTGTPRRLRRSEQDRIVAGVCGGIAEYLSIDPSLVRIAFVVATLWGVGPLLYLALAIVLPVEDGGVPRAAFSPERSHTLAGTLLIVLGAVLLAANMGWAPWLNWNLLWPSLLIAVGIGLLVRGPRSSMSA